ncbi:MAG: aminopeptidase, partial [Candidatus Eremiobacteraeota bacterium]|nr:aminopeptidase [Candidatus Eremiobacteraeota bacterium]
NGLYPSKYTAQQYGITLAQLSDLFWNGVNADPAAIQASGESIRSSLGSGAVVHVTAPNGTDVTFRAAQQTVVINNGTISSAARKKGGAALNVSLPAGDVTFVPTAGSAKGTVVFGPVYVNSTKVTGLTLHLAAGKLSSWTASSGRGAIDGYYKAAGGGKDEFTFADIGTNPNIHFIRGSALNASMASGMVSLGVGNNLSIGGTNSALFGAGGYIPDATVTIGGKTLVSRGRLVKSANM